MKLSFLLILAVFISATARADLVAHYQFEEAEPSDGAGAVLDSAGTNHGTTVLPGGVTQGAAGKFGNAINFTAGGVDLGTSADVQPTDQFTITFWLSLSTINAFDRFLESQSGNGNGQHGIRVDTGSSGNQLRTLVRSGNAGGNTQHSHSTTITADTWYFAATRYDSTSSNLSLTLIQDNPTVGLGDVATATQSAATFVTGPLITPHARSTLVGIEVPAGNPNNLRGSMDDLAFFNHVLSDQELLNVYQQGAQNFMIPEPHSLGLLLFGGLLVLRRLRNH